MKCVTARLLGCSKSQALNCRALIAFLSARLYDISKKRLTRVSSVQSFINKSFEKIISTDHALRLLHQFEYILNRDSLKVRWLVRRKMRREHQRISGRQLSFDVVDVKCFSQYALPHTHATVNLVTFSCHSWPGQLPKPARSCLSCVTRASLWLVPRAVIKS